MKAGFVPDRSDRSLAELCSLAGKTAVVTGAAKGIGRSCARRLAEAGANIALLDIDQEGAEQSARQIEADFGVMSMAFGVDLSDRESTRGAIAACAKQFGSIDIWVNNAGIFPEISTLDITDADYDHLMNLNQRGMFLAARDAASEMTSNADGGVIINMISVSALVAATNSAHYVAAKHAMYGATKAFARDLAPHGIRVMAIAPTLIRTPGVEAGLAGSEESRKALESFIDRIPLGRAGEPDEVARAVYFAASDLAAFMTGSVLVVDGGELVL